MKQDKIRIIKDEIFRIVIFNIYIHPSREIPLSHMNTHDGIYYSDVYTAKKCWRLAESGGINYKLNLFFMHIH